MTVGELVSEVDIGQSTVSHHLKVLAETGFVILERQGNVSWYRVNDRCLERFPSAAEVVTGVLPRYETRDSERAAPWQEKDAAASGNGSRRTRTRT